MSVSRPLDVVFLTSFSDTCFRAIPTLSQMFDDLHLRLTLVHAVDPTSGHAGDAQQRLRSFFPEADRYADSQRRVMTGHPVEVVRQLRAEGAVDLVVVPAGEPLGLPRFTRSSVRAQLLAEGLAPLWTMGPAGGRGARPTRSVACCVQVGRPGLGHLRLACDYAATLGAALHVVHVLPDIDESALLRLAYARPFDSSAVRRQVDRAAEGRDVQAHVHGTPWRRLGDVLEHTCDADVVFVDGGQWIERRWFTRRVSQAVDAWRRPVICVDGARESEHWPLARRTVLATRQWPALVVSRPRPVQAPAGVVAYHSGGAMVAAGR